jgi:hypothetical protein
LNDATYFVPPEKVFAPRTCLDAEVSAAKAKWKMFFEKSAREKQREAKIRKRTLFARKRTVCAGRERAKNSPHPNNGTQLRVKMFQPASLGPAQLGCRRVDTLAPLINNRWT